MAKLYECDVADLLAGWGEHRVASSNTDGAELEAMAWQVGHLNLHELTRSLADWALRLPVRQRRALLLKLSTAAAVAASAETPAEPRSSPAPNAGAQALGGRWTSTYQFHSTSRSSEFDGTHTIDLRVENGRLVGRSISHPSESELQLAPSIEGSLATGSWTERTSPSGHYRAAIYHGVLQLVVDPTARVMSGRWLGLSKRYTVKTGAWRLEWSDQGNSADRR